MQQVTPPQGALSAHNGVPGSSPSSTALLIQLPVNVPSLGREPLTIEPTERRSLSLSQTSKYWIKETEKELSIQLGKKTDIAKAAELRRAELGGGAWEGIEHKTQDIS